MRLLVVEDDQPLREGLVDLLEGAGHEVVAVGDGQSAADKGCEEAWDVIVLDRMLPKLSGVEVCRRIRTARPAAMILMLTAMVEESQKVEGLEAGADDYVTKPFGVRELLARVEALGRRAASIPSEPEELEIEDMVIDLGKCTLARGGETIPLTAREVGLIRWLHRHKERAVSRAELLEHVWGLPGDLETRSVDMAVANLRKKIENNPAEPRIVKSVKGVGYMWGLES